MNNKENKSSKNYFENILSLLTNIRNAVILMLGFFAIAWMIDTVTTNDNFCVTCYYSIQYQQQIKAVKSTAYTKYELEQDSTFIKTLSKDNPPIIRYYSGYSFSEIPDPPLIPKSTINRWKLWQNHQNRVHQILYNH